MVTAIVPSLLIMNLSGVMFKKTILNNSRTIAEQTAGQVEQHLLRTFNELQVISDTVFSSARDQWVAEVLLNNAAIRSANFSKFYISGYEEGTENSRIINAGNNQIFLSEIWISKENVPYIKISRETYGIGKTIYINGILDLHTLWNLADSIRVGDTGKAVVLTESFEFVASAQKGDILSQSQIIEKAARDTESTFTTRLHDNSGKIHYLSLSSIPITGWYGGIQQAAAEALKPLIRTTGQSIAIIALVIILFLLLFFLKIKQNIKSLASIPDTMIRQQDENLQAVSKTINDVSLRLKTGPLRFITIADTVDVPIIITTKELLIEFTNLQFQKYMDLHPSEIIGSPIKYFLTPGSFIRLKTAIQKMEKDEHEIPDINLEFVRGQSKTEITRFIVKKNNIGGSPELFFVGSPGGDDSLHSQVVSDDIKALSSYFSGEEEKLRSSFVSHLTETIERPLNQFRSLLSHSDNINYVQLDTIISRFRHKMRKIDSPIYNGFSLKSAATDLIDYLKKNTSFEYRFIYKLGDEIIDKNISLILYRCTVEMLMASIENSNASRFTLEIGSDDDNIILNFEDNRTGKPILEKNDLDFLIQKIQAVDGSITERSSVNSVNVVQIKIPDDRAAADLNEGTDHEDRSSDQ